ncbi:MAG: lipocalin-like domain-containing protein [Gammaproteobacteria bacterium]|nr:lipocalin-like domain-containing protein [Gammaproteobacteria bacterium]
MKFPGAMALAFLIALTACQRETPTRGNLDLGKVLGGQNIAGFERALDIREFRFPQDHAAHPGFRNEWWYLTGNVADEAGRFFGYQVTFFRTALTPTIAPTQSNQDEVTDPVSAQVSNWVVRDVWMAHAAVTDIKGQQHYATQRFSRANPGLAGAVIEPVRIWLEDWELSSKTNEFPWHLSVKTSDFDLDLALTPTKNLVLQGDQGLSQKSPTPGNASYYYSYSRMQTDGQLRLADQSFRVSGLSWFDREWSTSSLDANQSGWNWFSLQFDTGDDLMYYQLLDQEGRADANSQGKWIDRSGESIPIQHQDMELKVLEEWQSDAGQRYPIRWRMDYAAQARSWILQAAVKDQLMDLAVKYWEGAVEIYDPVSKKLVGRGYLEMTRLP